MSEAVAMTVRSTDLRTGDVVVFADIRDEVLGVVGNTGLSLRVNVRRRFTDGREEQPVDCFFWCGINSEQEILRTSCKG